MPKSATRTVTLDPAQAPDLDGTTDFITDDPQADYQAATDAELCPICHDLLAWHEQACEAPAARGAVAEPEEEAPVALPTAQAFAFGIGHRVQPTFSAPAAITWRGQTKERHPATGLVQRINVYYLDNGYWDCYREEELQAA
ncbi:hypothetical protein JAO73_01775 [Hymenobacter sp. BT523]|uniref:hypothetical protein n=1 Tax=Hymenobacter sp. BT523 TaxID=2795725 RepID=UPI0018EAACBA|nr:hypothetical protein [Hymenobacter sp. BT523]MBJ6107721.1 hypothetical protein [Hymenobacter sp. BT523]